MIKTWEHDFTFKNPCLLSGLHRVSGKKVTFLHLLMRGAVEETIQTIEKIIIEEEYT